MDGTNAIPAVVMGANAAPSGDRWKKAIGGFFEKIWEVVCLVFKAIALGTLLFINPTIFALSFSVGVVWDEEAQRIVDKIENLVTNQKLFSGFCLLCGAFIALPVTIAAVTVYGGLRLGLFMNA